MQKNENIAVFLLICLFPVLLLSGGCNGGPVKKSAGIGVETIKYTDSAEREVEIPARIARIVPSGTIAQIVLFSLAPDKLVGLSEKWSPAAGQYIDARYHNLPVLGQFYGGKGNLNLEEIARIGPQLIIDIGEPKSSIVEDMDRLTEQIGIPAVHITATLETMGEAYRALGQLLDLEKEAAVLAEYCEEIYSKTERIMEKVGEDNKIDLLYCSGDDGLNVIARGSFHAEIVDLVGNNVAVIEDIAGKATNNPVDMEQIVLWDPGVIIFAPGSFYDSVDGDNAWQGLSAVRNGCYYEAPAGPNNWMGFPPSVNRYLGMIWLAWLLYPEKAGYDLYKEVSRYHELFYHRALTEEQYRGLVVRSLRKDG